MLGNAHDVYEEMFGGRPMPDISNAPDIRRGRVLEPIARKYMADAIGMKIVEHDQNLFVYNEQYPWAHTLPDGWVPGEGVGVELKCPRQHVWKRNYLDGIEPKYQIQCQHSMALTGAKAWWIGLFDSVAIDILAVKLDRDEAMIAKIMEAEHEFYRNGVAGIAPPAGKPDAGLEIEGVGGAMVSLEGPEIVGAVEAWRESEDLVKEATALKDAAKGRLLALLGSNTSGRVTVDGRPLATLHNSMQDGRTTFDWKSCVTAFPETAKFKKVGSPFSTFRLYYHGPKED